MYLQLLWEKIVLNIPVIYSLKLMYNKIRKIITLNIYAFKNN